MPAGGREKMRYIVNSREMDYPCLMMTVQKGKTNGKNGNTHNFINRSKSSDS